MVIIFGLGTPTLRYSEHRSALGGGAGLGCCPRGRRGSHDNRGSGSLIPRPSEAPLIYGVTTKTFKFYLTDGGERKTKK